MRALEQQQAQELLNIPYDPNSSNGSALQHLAVSAPTTPPRINAPLGSDSLPSIIPGRQHPLDPESLLKAVGSAVSDKRKSVTLAPLVDHSTTTTTTDSHLNGSQNFARTAGAKSMPASRRTSASGDDADLSAHLQNLALVGDRSNSRLSPVPVPIHNSQILLNPSQKYQEEDRRVYGTNYSAGMMLDEQLDQEMHSMLFLSLFFFLSLSPFLRRHEEPPHFRR